MITVCGGRLLLSFVARDALFMLPRVRCQIPLLVEQGFCKDFIKATSPLCPLAFFTANIAHGFLTPFANQMQSS